MGNQLSYSERYTLPNGFLKNDDPFQVYSSSASLATVTTHSTMEYNANNKGNPVTQNIDNIDIKISDKLALNLFANRTSSKSEILKQEKSLKDNHGFFRRLADRISKKFSSLFHLDEPTKKPKP